MTAESFDAVLAEAAKASKNTVSREWLDRLQAAHEREVGSANEYAERCTAANTEAELENGRLRARADAAVALLRECLPYVSSMAQASHLTDGFSPKPENEHDEMAARLTAFLSEQAGERENGDGYGAVR